MDEKARELKLIANCKSSHARYMQYVREADNSMMKAFWLGCAAEKRLTIQESYEYIRAYL